MKDKKLQIFVSSTYTDLKEERQAAVEAILSSGHIPAGMELFAAGDESQMTVIKRWIDESDIYLLILGGRYGSIDKTTGKSYTQLEFEYALEKNKPLFSVVISDEALEKKIKALGSSVIETDNTKEYKAFKENVLSNLVKFWDDKKDIKIAIHETLSDFSYRKDLIGWIRGNNSVDAVLLAEEIAKLTNENFELRKKIITLDGQANFSYSGLTYNELQELLKSESVKSDSFDITLFDFILNNGQNYITWKSPRTDAETNIIKRLMHLKVIERNNGNSAFYKLTDEGHNFFLKALLISKREKV